MKKIILLPLLLLLLSAQTLYAAHKLEPLPSEPVATSVYKLDNGLTVYISQNDESPRVRSAIAVRVGAKNDPRGSEGMAHYFEHIMFKGTSHFGTVDYAAEKPLLDKIEREFEHYRSLKSAAKRRKSYAVIDSLSSEAAHYAVANEYVKMFSAIGGVGANAWTTIDATVYVVDIPSNRLEQWAQIESERFKNAVIRGFHTELETVYEEYNMSLAKDSKKVWYAMLSLLFPNHPYGQHTVLGTQQSLKNPSITQIKQFYNDYYAPNNMAICLSGDVDPDKAIALIERYFGDMTPCGKSNRVKEKREAPIRKVVRGEVLGNDSEFVLMGWRTAPAAKWESNLAQVASLVLYNGRCGLMDTYLNQPHLCLTSAAWNESYADRGAFLVMGNPNAGQPLSNVEELMLDAVLKLTNGDFSESLVRASVSAIKLRMEKVICRNDLRSEMYAQMYTEYTEYTDWVRAYNALDSITKQDIVQWAKANLKSDNYAVVTKLRGEDKSQVKIDKPKITPIETNRDAQSEFSRRVINEPVEVQSPKFVDFDQAMQHLEVDRGVDLLYVKKENSKLFSITYLYDIGASSDPVLAFALNNYLPLASSASRSLQQMQRELYALACDMKVVVGANQTSITITGLAKSEQKAILLVDGYLFSIKADKEALDKAKRALFESRRNEMTNQKSCFAALQRYVLYGGEGIRQMTLSNERVARLSMRETLRSINMLKSLKHRVLYCGASDIDQVADMVVSCHKYNGHLTAPKSVRADFVRRDTSRVFVLDFDSKQVNLSALAVSKGAFDASNDAAVALYNSYFGQGMNSIVFQEMRESRALAYSASAGYAEGFDAQSPYYLYATIFTQNDKMVGAMTLFENLIDNMPESATAFALAKDGLLDKLSTSRTVNEQIMYSFLASTRYGIKGDRQKALYERMRTLTLLDVADFQRRNIKGCTYGYALLGSVRDIDMDFLRTKGDVVVVERDEVFGY